MKFSAIYNSKFGQWTIRKGGWQERGETSAIATVLISLDPVQDEAHARLLAASPELLECQTMGESLNTPDFLDWMADRIVKVYGESPNVDFVISLRARAKAGHDALRMLDT